MGDPKDKVIPLTNAQKMQWNQYIDFMDKQGMKGNPALDDRSKQLGEFYFNRFKALNPGTTLVYQDVPRVQQALQDYRQNLINQWKSGKMQADGVKSEADIMGGISPVDGWLGSKTSSYKFPVAVATNGDGTQQNFGVNTQAYDAARGIK